MGFNIYFVDSYEDYKRSYKNKQHTAQNFLEEKNNNTKEWQKEKIVST